MPRLKMLRGPEPGIEIPLEDETITIGRGRKNTIIVQDNEVSRVHCRLVRVLDDYEIHDLKSTNGTFINGQRIDDDGWLITGRSILELGDSITFEYIPSDVATGTSPPMPAVADMTPPPPYYLVIVQRSVLQPEIYLLDRLTITIGRDVDNDIVLDEPEVSRHHMRFVQTIDGYSLEDLNTMNGTSVNKRPLSQQRILQSSDMITVGTGVQMWYTDSPDRVVEGLRGENVDVADDTDTHNTRPPETATAKETETFIRAKVGHGLSAGDLEQSVFLAYARPEWENLVAQLQAYLDKQNFSVWSEQYLLPTSPDWDEAIEQATQEAHCLLAVISEASLEQPYVLKAIRHFLAREKPVLLLQYGSLKQAPMMLQSMSAIPYDEENPERTFRLVAAELKRGGC